MKLVKGLSITILLVLLLGLAGCGSRQIILYPIDKQDIVKISRGENYIPDRDGYFLSDFYIDEIAQAKIRE